MATWNGLHTWTVGEILTADLMNDYVTDNTEWLYDPPTCYVSSTVAQTITTGTETIVNFNAEVFDNANMHSTTTDNDKIYAPVAGLYLVGGQGDFPNTMPADSWVGMFMVPNDPDVPSDAANRHGRQFLSIASTPIAEYAVPIALTAILIRLNQGEYVQMRVYQSSGSNKDLNGQGFFMRWMAP